jgi:hypothetical protein
MLQQATTTHLSAPIERPLPNSKLEEAFYKCIAGRDDCMEKVATFRKLKAEDNIASATAMATLIVIDQTLYPLLENRGLIEAKQEVGTPDHLTLDREPDIHNHPEML